MKFTSLSGLTDFKVERDFKLKWVQEKGLWNYIASKVLNGKGVSITPRTVRYMFEVSEWKDLTPTQIAIWLESEAIVRKVITEANVYENTDKE